VGLVQEVSICRVRFVVAVKAQSPCRKGPDGPLAGHRMEETLEHMAIVGIALKLRCMSEDRRV